MGCCRPHPSPPLPQPLSVGCPAIWPCGPAEGSWPSGQAGVAVAMAYPWNVSWAPQATGMSQKYHPSGQHPNRLSQTAILIVSNRKILSDPVLVSSLENRWPPLQGSSYALLFPFSLPFCSLSVSNIVLWLQTKKELELKFQFFHFIPVF